MKRILAEFDLKYFSLTPHIALNMYSKEVEFEFLFFNLYIYYGK